MEICRIAASLPPVGGRLKDKPEHFVVEEIPLYEPQGHGPHLYLTLRRSLLTTREVVEELARRFNVPQAAIGYAGLKDKEAVTSQTFSLGSDIAESEVLSKNDGAPWELLKVSRHQNKLKLGHLLGNRFTIILSEPQGTLPEAEAIAAKLKESGVPNYFGEQRFGKDGDNFEAGLALLKSGRRAKGWRDKFLLSSLQSFVYNHYLSLRINSGFFEKIITGDICKKYATGGLFTSEDGNVESARLAAGELSHTGPIFGAKTMMPKDQALELENKVLLDLNLSRDLMAKAGAGDRRLSRLLLRDLEIAAAAEGFRLTFSLPKGAYATTVIREFSG